MPDLAIRTHELTKRYGSDRGIEGVTLGVRRGEVFGFLGLNGAGKTTMIRILLDLIRPTSGHATVLGLDCRADSIEIRSRVGYLPGELDLYGNLTGRQLVRYIGRLRDTSNEAEIDRLTKLLDIDIDRRVRDLSKGNKQKIGLLTAFMDHPELLILDEPTSGLDPILQERFQDLVLEARSEGRTVFLSSHVLPEVERICDRLALIHEGRLVSVESMEDLRARSLRRVTIRFASKPRSLRRYEELPGIQDLEMEAHTLRFGFQGAMDALMKAVAKDKVVEFLAQPAGLDDLFHTLYGAPDPRADSEANTKPDRHEHGGTP